MTNFSDIHSQATGGQDERGAKARKRNGAKNTKVTGNYWIPGGL
jgi:hypothetical protein